MRKNIVFTLLIAILWSCSDLKTERTRPELRFNEDGTFTIMQLTDLHYNNESERSWPIPEQVQNLVKAENPDLVILTGDIVTSGDPAEGWKAIGDMMAKAGVPYAVTIGNHDPEITSREFIFDYLETQPLFVGEKGPEHLKGMGTYALEILASDGSDKARSIIYCMDSNDYHIGYETNRPYAWIEWDKIAWYRNLSRSYTEANGGKPLPSLAFFHIPTFEYKLMEHQPDVYGVALEGYGHGSSDINSGLLSSFLDMGDVTGVFTGHDHDNDFIGKINGIALAHGRFGGYDTYGTPERGCRIVRLHEGSRKFDSWNSTQNGPESIYCYPAGMTDVEYDAMAAKKALNVNPQKNGINYTYYEDFKGSSTEEFGKSGKEVRKGVMSTFSISDAAGKDAFAYDFKAYLRIDDTYIYDFRLTSDDGAVLYIDGEKIADNDGSHSASSVETRIKLEKGFHEICLKYFDDCEGERLEVLMSGPDFSRTPVPAELLYKIEN